MQAGPQKGQRTAVLWTQLQARVGRPGSPHPGPSFPHCGPSLVGAAVPVGSLAGVGDLSSALAPTLGYTYIHSS